MQNPAVLPAHRREPSEPRPLLAALPHLFFAASTALIALESGPGPLLSAVRYSYYGFLAIVAVSFIIAWRRRWPLWSGSWAGYWLLAIFGLSSLPVWPWLEALYPAFLAILLLGALLLFQRRPLFGLLAIGPILIFYTRLFVFELVSGGDWIFAALWLLLALVSAAIVIRRSIRLAVPLLVAFHLLAGLAFALGVNYLPFRFPEMGGSRQPADLATLINDFLPPTLATIAAVLALPLLQPLRRLAGERGRRRYALFLVGVLLAFGAVLAIRTGPSAGPASRAYYNAATLAVAAGLLLSLVAAFLIARSASPKSGRFRRLLVPALAVFAPLVVFAPALPFAPDGRYSDATQLRIWLHHAAVILWIVAALLVLTGVRRRANGRD